MNVLHINQSDMGGGGAAIAGYRLHQGLLDQGIESRLLVGQAKTQSDRVAKVPRNSSVEHRLKRLTDQMGLNYINFISTPNITRHPFYQAADVLNFHNLHTGYFNYLAIPQLTKHKPAVLTLHDMWSFTGHCAYSYDCDRWQFGCGKCPYPDIYPAIKRDSTRLEWQLKQWVYEKSNLTIVAPSKWLTEQAQTSMLSRFAIHHIPYGINTEAYQPLDLRACRTAFGIPLSKKVILFGAFSLKDERKGGDLLLQALSDLPASLKAETVLLTFGDDSETFAKSAGMPVLNLGYVTSDRIKSMIYSAADVLVVPTRADNLPLVLQESLACGTPMISFRVGGVPDLVRPDETGYLAEPEDVADLGSGILKLLDDEDLRERMRQRCRAIAVAEFSLELQATRYLEVYQQVLRS